MANQNTLNVFSSRSQALANTIATRQDSFYPETPLDSIEPYNNKLNNTVGVARLLSDHYAQQRLVNLSEKSSKEQMKQMQDSYSQTGGNAEVEVLINDAPLMLSKSSNNEFLPPAIKSLRFRLSDYVLKLNKQQHDFYMLYNSLINISNFVANIRIPNLGNSLRNLSNVKTKYLLISDNLINNELPELYNVTFRLFLTFERELDAYDKLVTRQKRFYLSLRFHLYKFRIDLYYYLNIE